MINEVVSENEWRKQFPIVDQEYIWEYPLFRGESEPTSNLFINQDRSLTNDLGIYIHVPFCLYRCPMCGFYMEIVKDRSFSKEYTDALICEFETYVKSFDFSEKKLRAIYFGGGTASLLEAKDISRLITNIKKAIPNSNLVEITVENHPSVATSEYLSELKHVGINRVSFGIQSLFDEDLKILGLRQRKEQNIQILDAALNLGFDTVAADLIYSIPNQSIERFMRNVEQLVSMGISTISLYSMGLSERQQDLYSLLPGRETEKEMFTQSMNYLRNFGYIQVAQPDFCLPNHINADTEITWKAPQGEQIALGAGAWSYFNNFIYCNTHNSKKYIADVINQGYSIQQLQKSTIDDQMSRYMVLGSRCFYIPDSPFKSYFGISLFDVFGQEIRLLNQQGLINIEEDSINVTDEGRYYVDNISKTFYSFANRCRLQPYCYGLGEEWRK
ncbi:coproporphyrinogen-III oxidase family protein [Methanobrevibacter sp.]|uniref:coproporphyrinogen-III oxidase family protein n=1 Tax=Methanobrevibacter sp. TaxID=66852 RepID=UPI00388E35BA